MALGRLLTEAQLVGDERALVIGAGTGYSAAVLERLVAEVVALEEDEALLAQARAALKGSGVALVEGPLNRGYAKRAPYDFILIDGAIEHLPPAIIAQAGDNGQIAFARNDRGVTRLCIGRMAGGAFGATAFADAAAAMLPGFEQPRGFSF
jgi:protein-L-isoaspartate(D-aspartate) O-methyltransferase